jgi:4-diphosphocytidyl-2-C-methyl-D-erythritol kinase
VIEAARLTGADVPVCLSSRACVMTGVGETLLPLDLPKMPCVLVNPRVPVATSAVFTALGLRHGEMLVGATDVIRAVAWPEAGASFDDWIAMLTEGCNDLESPAMRIQPVIDEVLSALRGTPGVRLARMSGSGATCFAIFDDGEAAQHVAQSLQVDHPLWWVHAGTLG